MSFVDFIWLSEALYEYSSACIDKSYTVYNTVILIVIGRGGGRGAVGEGEGVVGTFPVLLGFPHD